MTDLQNDTYVEKTRTSWFGRIKNALGGLIIGPIFIIGGVILLTWNEGRSARAVHALHEGQRSVVSVSADALDPTREGKLVYVQGAATTNEILDDLMFGVRKNALWLRRDAEMYQWKEEEDSKSEKGIDGSETTTTTYSYHKVWSSSLIDSDNFKRRGGHENPSHFRAPSELFVAQDARLGSFRLDPNIVRMIDGESILPVEQNQKAPAFPDARVHDGGFYIGANPRQPSIGDTRVQFHVVTPSIVSVVAAQAGEGLGLYVADNGYEIALIRAGTHTAEALFQQALDANAVLTWLIRFGGLLALFVGFSVFLSIITVLADIIPIVGTLVGLGTGFVAFLLAVVTGAITIAVAWVAHRPLAAAVLVGGVVIVGVWLCKRRARKAAAHKKSEGSVSTESGHRAFAGQS